MPERITPQSIAAGASSASGPSPPKTGILKWVPDDFGDWNIPERFRSAKLTVLNATVGNRLFLLAAQQHQYRFLQGQPAEKGFCVWGPHGLGKTHALYCVARTAIVHKWRTRGWVSIRHYQAEPGAPPLPPDKGDGIVIRKWRRVLKDVDIYRRQRGRFGGPFTNDPVEEICSATRIFLDDFTVYPSAHGGNVDSPYVWQKDVAMEIMDLLWERKPGTFSLYVTSNNTPEQMADAWSDQTIDRLRAMTEGFELTGETNR